MRCTKSSNRPASKNRLDNKGIYRSKFEADFAKALSKHGLVADYEKDKLKYIQPEQARTYTPDWTIRENVFIETKGRFTGADRKKMLWVRDCAPEGTIIYLLFMRSSVTLSKSSKTSYGDWATKNNFVWADIKDIKTWKEWFLG